MSVRCIFPVVMCPASRLLSSKEKSKESENVIMKIERFLFCFIFVNKNVSNQTGYVPITRVYLALKSNIHVAPYCKETHLAEKVLAAADFSLSMIYSSDEIPMKYAGRISTATSRSWSFDNRFYRSL